MFIFFFFNDTATTEIYTLSLHDALPIYYAFVEELAAAELSPIKNFEEDMYFEGCLPVETIARDRKSTRLNSSHANISYAVFCLKKKNKLHTHHFYPEIRTHCTIMIHFRL